VNSLLTNNVYSLIEGRGKGLIDDREGVEKIPFKGQVVLGHANLAAEAMDFYAITQDRTTLADPFG
jgi:hypothetical protein